MSAGPLPAAGGSYVLFLRSRVRAEVAVGRRGLLALEPGILAYVGSALGPGGLAARVGRHLAGGRPARWHVDHLLAVCPVERVWLAVDRTRLEHRWAAALASLRGARVPLAGFGSSDCRCRAHLLALERVPSTPTLRRALGPGRWHLPDPAGGRAQTASSVETPAPASSPAVSASGSPITPE